MGSWLAQVYLVPKTLPLPQCLIAQELLFCTAILQNWTCWTLCFCSWMWLRRWRSAWDCLHYSRSIFLSQCVLFWSNNFTSMYLGIDCLGLFFFFFLPGNALYLLFNINIHALKFRNIFLDYIFQYLFWFHFQEFHVYFTCINCM